MMTTALKLGQQSEIMKVCTLEQMLVMMVCELESVWEKLE